MYMKVILYYSKDKIIEVDESIVIDELYYKLATIPTIEQLDSKKYSLNDKTNLIKKQKEYISTLVNKIPLFDYSTKNIYLVNYDDIYIKVSINNYRFPDKPIIDLLNKTIKNLQEISINKDTKKYDWIDKYIEKINKNLQFLNNFDLDILKDTYTNAFLNTNPTTRELTTCIKPSYLPYQKYQSPYYTKSELTNMGLNLNIIFEKDIKPTKSWKLTNELQKKICKKLSDYEVTTQMLIHNQLYILYNNAKSYVQFYSLFGSYYFNSYLRNNNQLVSFHDLELENHINNFLQLIKNAPAFDSSYEVYRFIENDDYLNNLEVGDTFNENSFISTTRNPFYSVKNNVFGFILLKIRIPKNKTGIALLIESYSNYPDEQEIILPPSKLKLVDINENFKYYHWDKNAEKKITKKYIFEYIEPLSYDIKFYIKNHTESNIHIPTIDFTDIEYSGSSINEKTLNFFNSLPKINLRKTFYSTINKKKYHFYAYFLTQNKVYSKFFFLQREDETNIQLGDEIYLTVQNPDNGNIELIIEIRNIISINYYHRYAGLSNEIPEQELLYWLSLFSKSLSIDTVIIHGNYSSYVSVVESILNKANISQNNLLTDFKTIQDIDNPDSNILNLYTADIDTFCIDLLNYIFFNKKRFTNQPYITNKIPYHIIDKFKILKFIELQHVDELDNIYNKLNIPNITIIEFYKIIHNTYPYLIKKLQYIIILSLPKININPWHFYYIFKPFEYLYEKNIISYLPQPNINKINNLIKNLEVEVRTIHEFRIRE